MSNIEIRILDAIMQVIKNNNNIGESDYAHFVPILKSEGLDVDFMRIRRAVLFLREIKYVITDERPTEVNGNSVTIKEGLWVSLSHQGYYFLDSGGFQGEATRQKDAKLVEVKQLKVLRDIQIWIAVGTTIAAIYYLHQLWSFYHSCCRPH